MLAKNMIEQITEKNFEEVLPLIRAYQEFYCVEHISEDKNRHHFSRFLNDNSRGVLFLIRDSEKAVGFTTLYFGFSSTRAEEVGILNDLYILPEHRNKAYGKKLIQHAMAAVKLRGINRIQWLTAKNNSLAQKLYEGFDINKSEWYFYSKELQ